MRVRAAYETTVWGSGASGKDGCILHEKPLGLGDMLPLKIPIKHDRRKTRE